MTTTQSNRKNASTSYESIVREVRAGNVRPIYYLMGEESYYIDRLADFITDSTLLPEEKDFNLITLYGPETAIDDVINACKGFPMGAKRVVVCVREAQGLRGIDRLEFYLKQPQPSTVLICCHKNGSLDRRKKIYTLIEKNGVLFESKKLYDSQLPTFIRDYLKRKKIAIEPEAAAMLGEYVGADLNRLAGELDKLAISLPAGERTVTQALVRRNVAMTRDFSIFEMQDALVRKDIVKVNQIAHYFDSNPKDFSIQKLLASLFKFFSNLMLAYYAPEKSERGIAAWLGITEWQAKKNYLPAMRNYTGTKVLHIIEQIRRTDARSKGIDNPATSDGDLMKELFFFILH